MQQVNLSPKLPAFLKRHLAAEPLFLVDVGCSGGIGTLWNAFGMNLQAVGFDPLEAEIARLRASEKRPDFTYEAAWVGYKDYDALFPKDLREDPIKSRNSACLERTSAIRALNAMGVDYVKDWFNGGAEVKFTDRRVDLDDYLQAKGVATVDFIKVDTDGHDLEVLLGARETLARRGVLGVEVECQFQGPVHPGANVFCNIDRLMREAGFTLFDLDAWRYTRGAMPGIFLYDITGQTTTGSMLWGDALYLRDFGDPNFAAMHGFAPSPTQLAKMACLLELFGKNDSAAELILNHRQAFEPMADALLDALTPVRGGPGVYKQYLQLFDSDPTRFFPSKIRQQRQAS